MATRSGTVDPGLVLWLEEHEHLSPHEVATALEERSGLLALAGAADMREVEAAADRGDPDAQLAIDVYMHRLAGGIAAMTAATGGLDVLVFTGGRGRALIHGAQASGASGWPSSASPSTATATKRVRGDCDITAAGTTVRTLVITAREDLQIAREARQTARHPVAALTTMPAGGAPRSHRVCAEITAGRARQVQARRPGQGLRHRRSHDSKPCKPHRGSPNQD